MTNQRKRVLGRREFLAASAAASAMSIGVPAVVTASRTDSQIIVGAVSYTHLTLPTKA